MGSIKERYGKNYILCDTDIFKAIMDYIEHTEGIDLQHLYIDGSKFEANANKYTWVWKKATEKPRYVFFCHVDEKDSVHGKGHRKSRGQRYYGKWPAAAGL